MSLVNLTEELWCQHGDGQTVRKKGLGKMLIETNLMFLILIGMLLFVIIRISNDGGED